MRFICDNGFEHHVAANMSNVAEAVHEAGSKYLGWEMTFHRASSEAEDAATDRRAPVRRLDGARRQ